MPEPVSTRLELHGDVALAHSRPVEPAPVPDDVVHHRLADDLRQQLVQHEPLVMPGGQLPRLRERGVASEAMRARPIHRVVVEEDERAVQPSDHQVFVVAWVRNDRVAAVPAGQILELAAEADPQLCAVPPVVEPRARDRASAVHRVKVERRCALVGRRARIRRDAQRRSRVEGDVVVDELAEEVVPAVCVGLFGLLTLKLGSVIKCTGPLLSLSWASSRPPGLPRSESAARTASVARENAGSLRNMRPNFVRLVCTVALGPATARGAIAAPTPPESATAIFVDLAYHCGPRRCSNCPSPPASSSIRTLSNRNIYRHGSTRLVSIW